MANDLIGNILGIEGTSQNTRSSAVGPGQFIKGTWLDMIRKYHPELAQGKSDSQILALRTDPNYAQLGPEMTGAYARENQGILAGAGYATTPGNTYLAHFAGPGGAIKLLSANPDTPVSQILPAAVQSNPFLQDMTAKQTIDWAERKMAGTTPTASAPNPENSPPVFAAGDSPALGTPAPATATLPATPPPQNAQAAAPEGLAGLFGRMLGILPGVSPAAGASRIPAPAPDLSTPAPVQIPELDAMQFPNRQPVRLAPPPSFPGVRYGRGFY